VDALHDPAAFRAAVLRVAPEERDDWLDRVLGIRELPADGPDLPRHCVPYIPCSVDALVRTVDRAEVGASDVFVDIGCGVGRAAAFVHLLTGARVIGVEVQSALARATRALATRLALPISCLEGDAATLIAEVAAGTVFFLYCPFSGHRLATVLAALEVIARARPIRVGCVDLPLPPCRWLTPAAPADGGVAVYRSAGG
jgi:SAM-dependent methyltransferase